jgi:hypoxanthine phosphoribosyltransferase
MTAINRREIISNQQIIDRINELAKQIAVDLNHEPVILIGVLTGAFIITADLSRALWNAGLQDIDIDFVKTTSYVEDCEGSRCPPKVVVDLERSIAGKNVIIVEDIADTGHTLALLQKYLKASGPKSLKTFALLSKPSKREVDIPLEYVGFEIDGWIEGFGLDSLRACPSVMVRE